MNVTNTIKAWIYIVALRAALLPIDLDSFHCSKTR
jgi:hypothetical protein